MCGLKPTPVISNQHASPCWPLQLVCWGWHYRAGVGDEAVSKYSCVYVVVHHHPTSAAEWAKERFDKAENGDDHTWMISLPRVPLALFHVNAKESSSSKPDLAGVYHPEAVPSDRQEGVGRNVMQLYKECPSKTGAEVSSGRVGRGATKLAHIGFVYCGQRGFNVTTYRRDKDKRCPMELQVQLFHRGVAYARQAFQHAR